MGKVSKKYLIFALGLGLLLLLVLLPKLPASTQKPTEDEVKTQVAAALLTLEKSPMEGIMQLVALSEKYPKAPEPLLELGFASLKTQQHAKAVQRFEKVLEILAQEAYNLQKQQAYWGLSLSYEAELQVKDDALLRETLKKLLLRWQQEAEDENLKRELTQKIIQLN